MKIPRNLGAIVFATGLALSGCSEKTTCYDLSNEEIVCIKEIVGNNSMIITKTDGRVIEIFYSGESVDSESPIVDYIEINEGGNKKRYDQPEVLEEATKQFIDYAKRLRENEVKEGLRKLQ